MMKQFAMRVAPMCVALLVGCTAPPPLPLIDPAASPEQIVRALSNRKLTARGTSNDQFGLASFKQFLLPLERRCQTDGGQLSPLSPKEVGFTFRDANSVLREARVSMPQRIACRSSAGTLWGAALRYNETSFFPSAWAEAVFYYATIPLVFEPGATIDRNDPNSPANTAARIKEVDDCQPLREQYTKRLRSDPQVGMKVQYGVIVDVRFPLALVQFDEFGRRLNGRDQEWVQASTLGPWTNCPR
jgi:hypothetical protein